MPVALPASGRPSSTISSFSSDLKNLIYPFLTFVIPMFFHSQSNLFGVPRFTLKLDFFQHFIFLYGISSLENITFKSYIGQKSTRNCVICHQISCSKLTPRESALPVVGWLVIWLADWLIKLIALRNV